jgi:YVTN family beta-propeller protein
MVARRVGVLAASVTLAAAMTGTAAMGMAGTSASAAPRGPHAGVQPLLFVPSFSSNVVSVFDARTDKLVKYIGIDARGAAVPYVTPNQRDVFIVDGLSPYTTEIDTRTLTVQHVIEVPGTWGDRGSPLSWSGSTFWMDSIPQGDIEAISTRQHKVTKEFAGAGEQFANSFNGRWIFVFNNGEFQVLSTRNGQVVAEIPLSHGEGVLTLVSPDDKTVYLIGDSADGKPLDTVTSSLVDVIDVSNPLHPRFVKSITTGSFALEAAITPDGRQLWVANAGDGTVSVIDLATNQVVHTISTGRYICGLGFYANRAYIVQSPSTVPPTYATAYQLAIPGVIPGAESAPETGSTTWRPGIDPPGEIAVYSATTYQPLDLPTIPLPSEAFNVATVLVPTS